mgnify:CR=1 FL=1
MTRSIALLSAAALIAGAITFAAPSWAQAQDSAISTAWISASHSASLFVP